MSRTLKVGFAVVALLTLASCAGSDRVVAPQADIPAAVLMPQVGTGNWFAKGLAAAMEDSTVAATIRDILRDSPYARHRVHVQEMLKTPQGHVVLEQLAAVLKTDAASIMARLNATQQLALFMPSSLHRNLWKGEPGAYVAAQLKGEDVPAFSYGPANRVVPRTTLKASMGTIGSIPILNMMPFEVLARRSLVIPALGRETISFPDEPREAVAAITKIRGEPQFEEQLVSTRSGAWASRGRRDLRGTQRANFSITDSPDTTFIGRWLTIDVYDNMRMEDLEIEFQFEFKSRATGNQIVERYTQYTGYFYEDLILNLPVLFRKPDGVGRVYAAVIEDDGDWHTDHIFPSLVYQDETYNAQNPSHSPYRLFEQSGDSRCGLSYFGVNYECAVPGAINPYYYEYNMNVRWRPSSYLKGESSSPGAPPVSIVGSDNTQAGLSCSYTAYTSMSYIDMEWYLNGNYIGSGPSASFQAPSQDFEIGVGVYDANGDWTFDFKNVTIDDWGTCDAMRVKPPPSALTSAHSRIRPAGR